MSVLDKGISAIFRYLSFSYVDQEMSVQSCLVFITKCFLWCFFALGDAVLGSLLVPAVASVLGAAVVAMGMRAVVAMAGLLGAAVVAIGTRVEVATATILGAAVSLDCW